jgi:hypothetical protein
MMGKKSLFFNFASAHEKGHSGKQNAILQLGP